MPDLQKYYRTPRHVIAAGTLPPLLDIISIALRAFARKRQKQVVGVDDWLMVPATVRIGRILDF